MSVYATEWLARCDEDGCHWWNRAADREKADRLMAGHMAFRHPAPAASGEGSEA